MLRPQLQMRGWLCLATTSPAERILRLKCARHLRQAGLFGLEIMKFLKSLFRKGESSLPDISQSRDVRIEPLNRDDHFKMDATTRYFESMANVQGAVARYDYEAAAKLTLESMGFIPGFVADTTQAYGRFDISSIPTIEKGGRILALLGDDVGLAEMQAMIGNIPELEPWVERAEGNIKDRVLFEKILEAVAASPGCLQSDLKSLIGTTDGAHVAVLVSYLEKAGRLARVRFRKTYKLLLPGMVEFPLPRPKREVASHRIDHSRPPLHEVEISKLEYVPLPRSPLKWEEAHAGRERSKISEAIDLFEIRDADWSIESITKIRPAERPDTAFRITKPCAEGLILIDDLGRSEVANSRTASAMRYNRSGHIAVKAALLHDVYRFGVHPIGRGVVGLSREGVLHSYDDQLKPIIETTLGETPEIIAIRKRFNISDDELKNYIRCVALSRDASRYVFTVVDEAWCIGANGVGIWGAKLPLREGWSEVAASRGGFGTSGDVENALKLMELVFPFTPEELKGRYRTLAKNWHPDLNPGKIDAGSRMAALSAAAEVLTGIDPGSLPGYTSTQCSQELHRSTINVGGSSIDLTTSLQVGEKFASDWIYAASFAGASDAVYLAGYSGRVVLVNENGIGVRVYDVGTLPRQIVDTGRYLYLLTTTRLYVLRANALHALIDTYDGGELIVAQNGFGILEKKRLRWFSSDGTYTGSVVTTDPIRRVYFDGKRMVVETRQLRLAIDGVPDWWS
jgi:hypothetical protein